MDRKIEQNRDPNKQVRGVDGSLMEVEGSFKELEWPQPRGIFTDGCMFHPDTFLKKVADAHEHVVTQKGDGGELEADLQAFANLLIQRTIVTPDGAGLFKLLDYSLASSTPDSMIMKIGDVRHLRMDCLRVPTPGPGPSQLV